MYTSPYSTSLYIPCSSQSSTPPTLCILHFTLHHCTFPEAHTQPLPLPQHVLWTSSTLLYVTVHHSSSPSSNSPPSRPLTMFMIQLTLRHYTYPEAHHFTTIYFVHTSLYSTDSTYPVIPSPFPSTYFLYASIYSTSMYIPCRTPPPSPPLILFILHFTLRHCT